MATTINILITTAPGLSLPSTLSIPTPSTATPAALQARLSPLLPFHHALLHLRTASRNARLDPHSDVPLSRLLPSTEGADGDAAPILRLALSHPVLGGKGGFGSQLRAAGGRMSSKNKAHKSAAQSSSRNLDGRRLRTVGEAKALAEYLAVKPEMEKKEKEERRKRWEGVVAASEERAREVSEGKAQGNGRGDGKWIEEKEEGERRVRESVEGAMRRGLLVGQGEGSDESEGGSGGSGSESVEEACGERGEAAERRKVDKGKARKVWGWDDEDEDEDESSSDESEGE